MPIPPKCLLIFVPLKLNTHTNKYADRLLANQVRRIERKTFDEVRWVYALRELAGRKGERTAKIFASKKATPIKSITQQFSLY